MSKPARPISLKPHDGEIVCQKCELCHMGKLNCIGGVGDGTAKIAIVTGKITKVDDGYGEALAGDVQRKIKYLTEKAGIPEQWIFKTALQKCFDRKDAPEPTKKFARECFEHLWDELMWLKPKVVIITSKMAAQFFLPFVQNIEDYRGFPFSYKDQDGKHLFWIMIMYKFESAAKSPGNDRIMVKDLKLVKKICQTENYKPKTIEGKVYVLKTVELVRKLADKVDREEMMAVDLETTGLEFWKRKITCFAFAFPDNTAYVVPWDKDFTANGGRWTDEQKEEVRALLRRILMSKIKKTFQNGKFDMKFLRKNEFKLVNFDFDTMLGFALVEPDTTKNLIFIAQWLNLTEDKWDLELELEFQRMGKRDYRNVDSEKLFYYAGLDVLATIQARPLIEELLIKTKTMNVFQTWSMKRQTPMLADMEYGGARINREALEKKAEELSLEMAKKKEELCTITKVTDFNPNSPKQLKAYFQKARVKMDKLTKSGQISTDEETLTKLALAGKGNGVPQLILDYRTLTKLIGTYLVGKDGDGGLRALLRADSRISSTFDITGAYTGRLSSYDPNLQNIPGLGGIRELFIPDEPGDLFINVDYKQLEVRIAAALAKDMILIDEILNDVDMHSRNAAEFLMKMPEAEFVAIRKNKEHADYKRIDLMRTTAKAVTFGVLYGSTAFGVARRNNVPLEEAEKFIVAFFKKYKALNEFIKEQHRFVMERNMVVTPSGRFIKFHEMEWYNSKFADRFRKEKFIEEMKRISVNMPIQGHGSDIFQFHKYKLWEAMKKEKMRSRLVLTIHDGLIGNVKPDEKNEVEAMVPEFMNLKLNPGTRYEVPLEVDVDFTDRWIGKD